MLSGKRPQRLRGFTESDVIRVDIDQHHAAVFGDPVDLAQPCFGRCFAEQQKERRILRQRVRQLDVAASLVGGLTIHRRRGHPKWKNSALSFWLWFKRIGIES